MPKPCGCEVEFELLAEGKAVRIDGIIYCPTHAAAFDLLEVLETTPAGGGNTMEAWGAWWKRRAAVIAKTKPGSHHDAGPGPEHERGPNMKDVG